MKSEFGPIGDEWPCFSFSKKNVGQRLQTKFRPNRDIIIYVGTTNPDTTENPDHRSRIISAVSVEPNQILETSKIVPEEMWEMSLMKWGEKWLYSMAVVDAALMVGPPFPEARAVAPKTYASFAAIENRGNLVEAVETERQAVMALPVERIQLNLTEPVKRYMGLMRSALITDKTVKQEAYRMASNILDRVNKGGEYGMRLNPVRIAPNLSDLIAMITRKWQDDQKGKCALCNGPLTQTTSETLQPSADRIDSSNVAYDDLNTQITHLACNYAKNQWGISEFNDWLSIVRDVREIDGDGADAN
ncbi:MAG: hypothetical protein P4M05_26460 [Bradyrhizobium sp.]|nr:hypothetical protein [Bradyrhizobium sp.]